MGNHEFYNGLVEYSFPKYKSQIGVNHFKINNQSIVIEDIKIIGSTLWTNIPTEQNELIYNTMNDYRLIQKTRFDIKENITIKDTNSFNAYSLKYIEEELSKPFNGKIILLTHHLPLFNLYKKREEYDENLKFAYANDLKDIISKYRIDYWIFGHVHDSIDIKIQNTRFLCNPMGYLEENQYKEFKVDKYIEI